MTATFHCIGIGCGRPTTNQTKVCARCSGEGAPTLNDVRVVDGQAHIQRKPPRGVSVAVEGHSIMLVMSDGEEHTEATLTPSHADQLAAALTRTAASMRARKATR